MSTKYLTSGTATLRSAIKKLNERIAEIERKGYTETELYSELSQFAETVSGGKFYSKSGHLKIKIDVRNLTTAQKIRLGTLSGSYYTIGGQLDRTAQRYTGKKFKDLTPEGRASINQILKVGHDFHEYIKTMDATIYNDTEIKTMLRKPQNNGDVSYSKQAKFLEEVENPENWYGGVFKPWLPKGMTREEYIKTYDEYHQLRKEE